MSNRSVRQRLNTRRGISRRNRGLETLESRMLLSGITAYATSGVAPSSMAADNAGNLWMADASDLVKVNAATGAQEDLVPSGGFAIQITFNSSNNHLFYSGFSSPEAGFVPEVVEMDLSGNVVNTYAMPDPTVTIGNIVTASDGSVWFTVNGQENADGSTVSQLGRIDPSGNMTFTTLSEADAAFSALAAGPNGSIWFGTGGTQTQQPDGSNLIMAPSEIGHATANADGSINVDQLTPINDPGSVISSAMVAGDGSAWFTVEQLEEVPPATGFTDGPNRLVHASITGGNVVQSATLLPTVGANDTESLGGIGIDSTGKIWFGEEVESSDFSFQQGRLANFDPSTGNFNEMAVPANAGFVSNVLVTSSDVWVSTPGGPTDDSGNSFNLCGVHLADFTPPVTSTTPNITGTAGVAINGTLVTVTTSDDSPYTYEIDYGNGATASGTITADGSGKFTLPVSTTYASAGTYTTTVTVSTADGDTMTVNGTAVIAGVVVNEATSTTLTSSANPAVYGQQIKFTAAVADTGGANLTPIGTVQFYVDGSAIGSPVALDATGHASFTDSFLSGASHTIRAVYNPGANFVTSSSSINQALQAIALEADPANPGLTDLFMGSAGVMTGDKVTVNTVGSSNTGSTGISVQTSLNGVSTTTTYTQAPNAIYIYMQNGNENIQFAPTLTMNTVIVAGNGNDNIHLGNGNSVIMLGNGTDNVQTGAGTSVVIAGNGNMNVTFGNGSNDIVILGNGNNNITIGIGNNQYVQVGTGGGNIHLGNGSGDEVVLGSGSVNVQIGAGSNNTVILPIGITDHNIKFGAGTNNLIV